MKKGTVRFSLDDCEFSKEFYYDKIKGEHVYPCISIRPGISVKFFNEYDHHHDYFI